tara:strand:- start:260 stop:394 length:135 start_codon:yes stop_codon:yes gene_type:complete
MVDQKGDVILIYALDISTRIIIARIIKYLYIIDNGYFIISDNPN